MNGCRSVCICRIRQRYIIRQILTQIDLYREILCPVCNIQRYFYGGNIFDHIGFSCYCHCISADLCLSCHPIACCGTSDYGKVDGNRGKLSDSYPDVYRFDILCDIARIHHIVLCIIELDFRIGYNITGHTGYIHIHSRLCNLIYYRLRTGNSY